MSGYQYINSTGTIIADTADIITEVEKEWTDTLGDDLPTTPDTPQGVMITQEVQSRSNFLNNNSAVANQINPNLAGGVFLDAICALLGLERSSSTKTVLKNVALGGVAGTFIPSGTKAYTDSGNIFYSIVSKTLSTSGTAVVDFQSLVNGEVACGAGELINISPETAVNGLETVSNPTIGILGNVEQNDVELAQLRIDTLGAQGSGQMINISSAVAAVTGVTSFSQLENREATEQVISGITLSPHSIWFCVRGGSDEDIALALFNKSDGCGFNGLITTNIIDLTSGQTYPVKYDRPVEAHVSVRVNLTQGSNTSDLTVTAKQAIIDFVSGQILGERGWVVGYNASPFDLAAAIADVCPGVRIRKVEVAPVDTFVYQTTEIEIALNEIAILDESLVYINII